MKAITVKQPFASLIAWGMKPIENRSQRTHVRGTVQIHAGAQWYPGAKNNSYSILWNDQKRQLSDNQALKLQLNDLPMSAIIGEVKIVDCVQNHPSVWAIDGYWHWVLEDAIEYPEPIPCKGALSFWKPQGATVDAILAQHLKLAAL